MSTAREFPPEKVRAIVLEVAGLLKERKESVSVAETVSALPGLLVVWVWKVGGGIGGGIMAMWWGCV